MKLLSFLVSLLFPLGAFSRPLLDSAGPSRGASGRNLDFVPDLGQSKVGVYLSSCTYVRARKNGLVRFNGGYYQTDLVAECDEGYTPGPYMAGTEDETCDNDFVNCLTIQNQVSCNLYLGQTSDLCTTPENLLEANLHVMCCQ